MSPKIVTVVGATGAQGKGVVRGFINNPAYKVRTITRNPSSAAAKALADQGAEVVAADLDDLASLKTAFAGSHIIFGVTDFFAPFIAHQSPEKAMDVEEQQGINLARAAAATSTLEHYIWSTLPNSEALSNNKFLVPHFSGKNRIDKYIRTQEPALLAKTTFLFVTWYHSNYSFPVFRPVHVPIADKQVLIGAYDPTTPIQTIGDVSVNLGAFVRAAVEQPEKTLGGKTVLAAIETHAAAEQFALWAKAKGKQAQYLKIDGQAYRELWPLWGEEMGVMMDFWEWARENSWTLPGGEKVVGREELGITGVQSLEEAYKGYEL
ncbi:uncharacterized protein C8A04DRAFT_33379 [Dichotomopilus funicola]|uniref:NmrA-like domain-containing protein n=1 Tax=Dichotomopilus funicola TaxID=1934379 RepID=A0AAN6UTY1_9PEZI|nr:hypothetical protein C8A04DRAFT_33379 [Dichotomopilus funicola]